MSKASGTDQHSWSVSASFVDFDRDGWLDSFVGNYLRYRLEGNTRCSSPTGAPDYCTPDSYPALPDRLYRNRRNGTFADVTTSARVAGEFGPALGVSTADFNGDGWIDIYVANDGKENQLWLNRRDGTFENGALLAGVALPLGGKAEGSMGVDAGDFDNDGDEDLVMTELTAEGSNLYVNDGTGVFTDASAPSAIGPSSLAFTGFGTGWLDFDNDGRLDLLRQRRRPDRRGAEAGTRSVSDASKEAAAAPGGRRSIRGHERSCRDGVRQLGGRAWRGIRRRRQRRGRRCPDRQQQRADSLVDQSGGSGEAWLGLRLVGPQRRDMVGARVEIVRESGGSLWRRARADGSYASANDPRVLVGLGDSPPIRSACESDGQVAGSKCSPMSRRSVRHGGGRQRQVIRVPGRGVVAAHSRLSRRRDRRPSRADGLRPVSLPDISSASPTCSRSCEIGTRR